MLLLYHHIKWLGKQSGRNTDQTGLKGALAVGVRLCSMNVRPPKVTQLLRPMRLPGYFQRNCSIVLYKGFLGEFYMSWVPIAWAHHQTSLWMRLVSPSFFSLASASAVLMPSVSATIFTAVRATSCKTDAPVRLSISTAHRTPQTPHTAGGNAPCRWEMH